MAEAGGVEERSYRRPQVCTLHQYSRTNLILLSPEPPATIHTSGRAGYTWRGSQSLGVCRGSQILISLIRFGTMPSTHQAGYTWRGSQILGVCWGSQILIRPDQKRLPSTHHARPDILGGGPKSLVSVGVPRF